MKKILKMLIICCVCFLFVGLTSCGGNNEEKKIVDVIKEELSYFKDPDSVSIVSIYRSSYDGKVLEIKVSAKNSLGGTGVSSYYLVVESFSCDSKLLNIMFDEGDYWKEYYSPGGLYERMYGKNFYEFSFYKGDMYTKHEDRDDVTLGEDMLSTILTYADPDYSPSYDIGKINEYLNDYKEEMGWR